MEKPTNVTFNKLSLNLSPMWKNETSHHRQKSSPLNKSFHDSLATPAIRHNELDKYKEKISRCQKQSPIVKAFNNIDDFYRSIRPSSTSKKSRQACKEKFDSNLSFNSKKSSEDSESLSSIINIKQLEIFNEIISEDSLKQETEL